MARRRVTKSNMLFYFVFFLSLFLFAVIYQFIIWLSSLSLISWLLVGIIIIGVIFIRRKQKQKKEIREKEERCRDLRRQGGLKELRKMPHRQFEYYVCNLFRLIGYDAHVTPPTGDGGKDIMIYEDNCFAIAECIRYSITNKVTRPDIQKFHSAIIDCKAEKGYFITTGEFTLQAKNYVLDKPIILVNGEKLIEMIEDSTTNINRLM
ncbi:restriction endonuclease [Oceanobacillus polygoni]|uniref:Restriction system protein n=1 Tax=Oceanobacillus polygoni TaxID=1235259 RepID=A0A9X1CE11_9BACI|nr:restriction endonuclease [Oceanobacillus polygoni]MBP2075807.1 restriction system protein [Oceanobacillus polygoni]